MKRIASLLTCSLLLFFAFSGVAHAQQAPDFDLGLTFNDQGNGQTQTPLLIGLDPAASDGYEDDAIGPPLLPPGDGFAALIHPAGETQNYITDIRKSVLGPATFEYEFIYQTGNGPIEIAWDNTAIPDGVEAEIVDPLNGSYFQYDMNANSSLSIDAADGTGPEGIPSLSNPLEEGMVVRFTVLEAPAMSALSGSVTYFPGGENGGMPLEGVELTLDGDASISVVTGADGTYTLPVELGGDYTLSAAKADDTPPARGISGLDLTPIRRHVVNVEVLASPYKIIAADVNGSDTVTGLDLTPIRQLIVGQRSDLGGGGLWQCVVAGQTFDDPKNPFPFDTTRSYTSLDSDQSGQDFYCFRRADVNGSWTPAE